MDEHRPSKAASALYTQDLRWAWCPWRPGQVLSALRRPAGPPCQNPCWGDATNCGPCWRPMPIDDKSLEIRHGKLYANVDTTRPLPRQLGGFFILWPRRHVVNLQQTLLVPPPTDSLGQLNHCQKGASEGQKPIYTAVPRGDHSQFPLNSARKALRLLRRPRPVNDNCSALKIARVAFSRISGHFPWQTVRSLSDGTG